MSARPPRTPSYRLHRPSGQAVVTLNNRDLYLGEYDTPESHTEYDRVIAECLVNGRRTQNATDLTIIELILRYLGFVDGYYTSTEPANIRLALRPVRKLYGFGLVRDFGPLSLKAVRQTSIDARLCRNEINKRTRRIVRMFKWGIGEELLPAPVHQALKAVEGLRKGRADVRESKPTKPVPDAFVDALRSYVARQVWAMGFEGLTHRRLGPGIGCVNPWRRGGRIKWVRSEPCTRGRTTAPWYGSRCLTESPGNARAFDSANNREDRRGRRSPPSPRQKVPEPMRL